MRANLSYVLKKLHITNVCHDNVAKIAKLYAIRKGDAVIAITFSPYTAGTIKVVQYALEHQVNVVVISDSEISPVNIESTCLLKIVDVDVGDVDVGDV